MIIRLPFLSYTNIFIALQSYSTSPMHKVLFYWPNIVGYIRIALISFAFSKGTHNPVVFVLAYLLALILDAVDGYLARRFDQCSSFGAVLDMLCDRVSTCGLVVILTTLYPHFLSTGIFLIALDFVSHYVRMYASMMLNRASHKDVQGNPSWLLQAYYEYRSVMVLTYAAQEIWYLVMYLKAFSVSHPVLHYILASRWIMANVFGLFVLKQWINVLQLQNALQLICEKDEE